MEDPARTLAEALESAVIEPGGPFVVQMFSPARTVSGARNGRSRQRQRTGVTMTCYVFRSATVGTDAADLQFGSSMVLPAGAVSGRTRSTLSAPAAWKRSIGARDTRLDRTGSLRHLIADWRFELSVAAPVVSAAGYVS
jgi:hypothetical protein